MQERHRNRDRERKGERERESVIPYVINVHRLYFVYEYAQGCWGASVFTFKVEQSIFCCWSSIGILVLTFVFSVIISYSPKITLFSSIKTLVFTSFAGTLLEREREREIVCMCAHERE